jgi:hypothetical protein
MQFSDAFLITLGCGWLTGLMLADVSSEHGHWPKGKQKSLSGNLRGFGSSKKHTP